MRVDPQEPEKSGSLIPPLFYCDESAEQFMDQSACQMPQIVVQNISQDVRVGYGIVNRM